MTSEHKDTDGKGRHDMKFFELYRRSFASRITLAVAGIATVLSISQLALFYSLVG